MHARAARIVDILRDFLEVHRLLSQLAERHRAGGLNFRQLATLISDDEGSVLFRLKERCHAAFRDPSGGARRPTHREALFDLAVGSLFHEAMKLRESLYQREIYGPRVRALRERAGEESKALFEEFERMLGATDARLHEGVGELESLLRRTAEQLRIMINESSDDGTAARFLTEHEREVEAVFGVPLLVLLEQLHGSAAAGFERAGHSYLASGYFDLAARCFAQAQQHECSDPAVGELRAYALGMQAYLARDYPESLRQLGRWAAVAARHPHLLALARDAISRMGQLAEGPERQRLVREASGLIERLAPATPAERAKPDAGGKSGDSP